MKNTETSIAWADLLKFWLAYIKEIIKIEPLQEPRYSENKYTKKKDLFL